MKLHRAAPGDDRHSQGCVPARTERRSAAGIRMRPAVVLLVALAVVMLCPCASDSPKCHRLDITVKGGMCDGVEFRGGMCGPPDVTDAQLDAQISEVSESMGARFTIEEYNRLKASEYAGMCCRVNSACKSGNGPSAVIDIPGYVAALQLYEKAQAVVAEAEEREESGDTMLKKIRESKMAELEYSRADKARVAYCQAQMTAMLYCSSDKQCVTDGALIASNPGEAIMDTIPPFTVCCSALGNQYQIVCDELDDKLLTTELLKVVRTSGRARHAASKRVPGRETPSVSRH